MASTEPGVLTYHVVPRFDIAAKGGPLALGTIVTSLKRLVPLNRGEFHVKVPQDLKYTPVCQDNFNDTLIKVRQANMGAWFKALGQPAGGSLNVGGSRDLEGTVTCDSIMTTYFDPDPAGNYIQECLQAKSIQDWLDASHQRTSNLYMITGLKVARNLKFTKSSSTENHGGGGLEVKEPHTSAVDLGVSVDASSGTKQDVEFGVDDIIIGYRAQLFECGRGIFSGRKKIRDKGLLYGNLMNHGQSEAEEPQVSFRLLPIPEETAAQKQAVADEADECWVKWDAEAT